MGGNRTRPAKGATLAGAANFVHRFLSVAATPSPTSAFCGPGGEEPTCRAVQGTLQTKGERMRPGESATLAGAGWRKRDTAMRLQMLRSNIERYERLLETESNQATRHTLQSLLAEARAEACLVIEERSLEQGDKDLLEDALRWRMRAEEYHAVADATHNDSARETYLRLAGNYEALAKRAETRAAGRRNSQPKSTDK